MKDNVEENGNGQNHLRQNHIRCPPQNTCFSAKNVVHDPSWSIAQPRNKHMDHHPKEQFDRGRMEKACRLHKTCTLVSVSACLHGCMVACLYRCMPALYLSTDLPIYVFVTSIDLSAIIYLNPSTYPPIYLQYMHKCLGSHVPWSSSRVNAHTTSWPIVMTRANSDAHTYPLRSAHHLFNIRHIWFVFKLQVLRIRIRTCFTSNPWWFVVLERRIQFKLPTVWASHSRILDALPSTCSAGWQL